MIKVPSNYIQRKIFPWYQIWEIVYSRTMKIHHKNMHRRGVLKSLDVCLVCKSQCACLYSVQTEVLSVQLHSILILILVNSKEFWTANRSMYRQFSLRINLDYENLTICKNSERNMHSKCYKNSVCKADTFI